MARSISTRIYWTVFAACLITLSTVVLVVLIGYEDLETSMLELDLNAERDFALQQTDSRQPLSWNSANLIAFYAPPANLDATPPAIFHPFGTRYSGEIERDGKTYLITISDVGGGRLYLAKEITLFEEHEALFLQLIAVAAIGAILLSLLVSHISARRLAEPLQRFARTIRDTPVGPRIPRLPLDFKDAELQAIAESFNGFLDELEGFVRRERSLLGMASHELRTPIAVISGALEVLEQRNHLSTEDQKTVQRMQRATAEMTTNVDVLLKLSRRQGATEIAQPVAIEAILGEILADLPHSAVERIQLTRTATPTVVADPALVTMLLRNLIQNALQHTAGGLQVALEATAVHIIDSGSGLPEPVQQLLREEALLHRDSRLPPGLGLYIVTLICQRLNWRLETDCSGGGTAITLHFA